MRIYKSLIVGLFCLSTILSSGQTMATDNYFRSPLSIPIISSGSFGEIRSDHFHSGIDYKTQGTEGISVYAVADGFVSRIKISPSGYGNALYITHPNGYVSVYAHLKNFNNSIDYYAKQEQYKIESFAIDLAPDSNKLKVKKGDLIAFSGNSGRSFGAHLHFELREELSENPINPYLNGFKIKDNTPPVVKSIKIYPIGEGSSVNNSIEPFTLEVFGTGNKYSINKSSNITVFGNIAFGIEAYDLAEGATNNKGIYSIELLVDSISYFSLKLDKMDFNENRYINDLIDYKEFVKNKKKVIQSKKAINNNLNNLYNIIKNNGIIKFDDNKTHTITYILKDEKQNTSKLSFKIDCSYKTNVQEYKNNNLFTDTIYCYKPKRIEKENIILDFPINSIFDSLFFNFSQANSPLYNTSPIYNIHDSYTPILNAYTISIKIDSLSIKNYEKSVIVKINEKNEKKPIISKWENGYVNAKSFEFGSFTVLIDSIPPIIKPINISNNKNMLEEEAIIIKITDNLSGIATYKGTINGKWVLMEYDEKKNLLKYYFNNNKTKKGDNILELQVKDQKNNQSTYKVVFIK